MRLLTITDLDAGYHGQPVVRGLNLTVDEGEFVALLGPNGAGKTTTLLTISGLLRPLAGEVHLLGASVDHRYPVRNVRRGLAHVPEDRCLFTGLTVRENLRLSAPRGTDAVSDAVGHFPALQPLLDRPSGLLSGGEQQMLAVARGLAASPRLLLIDELSLGLAPAIAQSLMRDLRALADRYSMGVLLVEQHVNLALNIADRACALVRGRLVLDEPVEALRHDPSPLEACYLGAAAGNALRTPADRR